MNSLKLELPVPEEVKADLKLIKSELKDLKENFQLKKPSVYISKKDALKEFCIKPSTAYNWQKKGIWEPYQMGGRIYYKRAQIESSMIKLKR